MMMGLIRIFSSLRLPVAPSRPLLSTSWQDPTSDGKVRYPMQFYQILFPEPGQK
jgi:hypothetical protein